MIKRFEFPCEIDFMSVSSYDGTESIGDVRILKDMDLSCKNRSILVVEDIIDTGRTLVEVKKMFKNKGCLDVRCVTLLDKPSRRVCEIEITLVLRCQTNLWLDTDWITTRNIVTYHLLVF